MKLNYSDKPLIAMLHLKGGSSMLNNMIKETEIYFENGVDAVLAENYFGSAEDCERALEWLSTHYPEKPYGVNVLGDYQKAFKLAAEYGASFVQIDSVCGHLSPEKDNLFAKELIEAEKGRTFDVLGGLRFKYQPIRSGRTLSEDAELAKMRCDAVVTTGEGTGHDTPTDKLIEFRKVLSGFPLIVGAGVTAETVAEKLKYSDGVIVGSWLKDYHEDIGDVNAEYVRQFVHSAKKQSI